MNHTKVPCSVLIYFHQRKLRAADKIATQAPFSGEQSAHKLLAAAVLNFMLAEAVLSLMVAAAVLNFTLAEAVLSLMVAEAVLGGWYPALSVYEF